MRQHGPTHINKIWTADKVDLLIRLWRMGESASTIADRLGYEFSRDSVIGKARRLRLPKRTAGLGGERVVWTEAMLSELMTMWDAGDSMKKIAAHFAVPEHSVGSARQYYQLRPRDVPRHRAPKPAAVKPAVVSVLVDRPGWPTKAQLMGGR